MKSGLIRISDIKIGKRHRSDLGDVESLARSVSEVGLLHPVVLDSDNQLVSGMRRIKAYKSLGRNSVPFVVAEDVDDALKLLKAERDENVCRLQFKPTEATSLGMALEKLERPKAKERQRDGGESGGKASGKLPEASDTRDIIGSAIGMSGRTYEKAKAVVQSGDKQLIAEMDKTGAPPLSR